VIDASTIAEVQRAVSQRSGSRRREWIAVLLLAAAATAWVAATGAPEAITRWLWAAVLAHTVAMLRVPFVLFWRADAALLCRLPIPGRPMLDAALRSIVELAAQAASISVIAAVPLALVAESPGLSGLSRPAAVTAMLSICVAALIPAVAVGAGALVVSGKARQLLTGMGAESASAPTTSWLGVLPGLASAVVVLVAINLSGWLHGGRAEVGEATTIVLAMAGLAIAAIGVARAASDRVMPAMLRDVSALDRQQLATIEIAQAPRTLRAIGHRLSPPAWLLLEKHARMIARRFPMAPALGMVFFATIAISAIAAPDSQHVALIAIAAAAVYSWLLRGRINRAPVELVRLRDSLPFSPLDIRAASAVYVLWWWCLFVIAPGLFLVVRTLQDASVSVFLVGTTAILFLMPGVARR
jgi:hypothetical protein